MDTKSKQKTKTPKPYTAYTIFWRLERLWIIRERECKDAKKTYASFNPYHFDPLELEFPRPAKYKDLISFLLIGIPVCINVNASTESKREASANLSLQL
jgi:hypothetical protein